MDRFTIKSSSTPPPPVSRGLKKQGVTDRSSSQPASDGHRKTACATDGKRDATAPKRQRFIDSFLVGGGGGGGGRYVESDCDAPALARKTVKEFHEYMACRYPALCLDHLPRTWFKVAFDQNAGEDGGEERLESDSTARFLHEALRSETRLICPQPLENMWKWARALPNPKDVNVVVLGQDPYHTVARRDGGGGDAKRTKSNSPAADDGPITMADGLAFSVNPAYARSGKCLPPTLVNVMKLADRSYDTYKYTDTRFRGDLTPWTEDGVLPLNAVLTTVEGNANAHADIGWQKITDRVIEWLGRKGTDDGTRDTRVFMLWGREAKKKIELIDRSTHVVFTCCHPSPLSAYTNGWFERDVFKEANLFLRTLGRRPVRWSCRGRSARVLEPKKPVSNATEEEDRDEAVSGTERTDARGPQ